MTGAKRIFLIICFLLAIIIVYRYFAVSATLDSSELKRYNESGEVVELAGKIIREPDYRENTVKLTIETEKGRVLATVREDPNYSYGDLIRLKGVLETPVVFADFNYREYLLKDGIISVSSNPEIDLISGQNSLYGSVFNLKDRAREVIDTNLSPPQSSLLTAMILGDKGRMSDELKDDLSIAGVRHIVAISGLHILILSSIIISFLLSVGLTRNRAFYLAVLLIFLFIAMIGFSASAVRAGIMGGLFLLAGKLGRAGAGIRSIIIAFLLMLVFNPLLLFYDVGFQLSFLASLGIICLSSFFDGVFGFVKNNNPRNILAATFSAYVFTLPVLIYNFGNVSWIGVLTNLLVIPILYPVMVFGLAFVLAGLIIPVLVKIILAPVWLMLKYISVVVEVLSFDGASVTVSDFHWYWLLLFYLFLFVLVFDRRKSREVL